MCVQIMFVLLNVEVMYIIK